MNEEQITSEKKPEVPKNAVLVLVIAVIVVVLALLYLWVSRYTSEPIVVIEDNTVSLEEFMAIERPSLAEDVAQFDTEFSSVRIDTLESDLSALSAEVGTLLE
jgi:hypothetical protein